VRATTADMLISVTKGIRDRRSPQEDLVLFVIDISSATQVAAGRIGDARPLAEACTEHTRNPAIVLRRLVGILAITLGSS